MKILIEEHAYDRKVVENLLPAWLQPPPCEDSYKVEHVGYYRNSTAEGGDFIFFLPKVLMEQDGRVFKIPGDPRLADGFTPEELIDPSALDGTERELTEEQKDFLYEFAVWIYRSLAHYDETHPDNEIVWRQRSPESGTFRRQLREEATNTLLDVILALRRFARENQDYFLFKIQEKHSGANKISWTRTIAKTTAILRNGRPLYLNPVNKKKTIDFDEELLVIFYSILKYIKEKFSFDVKIPVGYELISSGEFERYLGGYGVSRLRQIKYKYFSDRDLMLWELCFAFFDKAHNPNIVSDHEEFLLAKDFDRVFEAMIDELVGDNRLDKYKALADNKRIDHLYVDEGLIKQENRSSLYIADSKYYRIGAQFAGNSESVAKQFTYARDMLQLNLNIFLPEEYDSNYRKAEREAFSDLGVGLQRDSVTEGYEVIPNFFISASMTEGFEYDDPGLSKRRHGEGGEFRNIHFENRLFDRDTLILLHYDVNFLYVLKHYALNDESSNDVWRSEVRRIFRDDIRDNLGGKSENGGFFKFYAITPHEGIDPEQFLQENFKYVIGKIASPYPDMASGKKVYSLALHNVESTWGNDSLSGAGVEIRNEQIRAENEETLEIVKSAFYCVQCTLGEDPRSRLEAEISEHPVVHATQTAGRTGVQVVSKAKGPLTKAVETSGYCPCPADQCEEPHSVTMLVLPFTQGAHLYQVDDSFIPMTVDKGGLDELTDNAFRDVILPGDQYWVWKVKPIQRN